MLGLGKVHEVTAAMMPCLCVHDVFVVEMFDLVCYIVMSSLPFLHCLGSKELLHVLCFAVMVCCRLMFMFYCRIIHGLFRMHWFMLALEYDCIVGPFGIWLLQLYEPLQVYVL